MGTWAIIGTVAASFALMEGVAWATHKYVMHGWLWAWHKDHHRPGHGRGLERNDRFFLVFAAPSAGLFLAGHFRGPDAPWSWMGLGILLYGIAYFLVHEAFIHRRVNWPRNSRNTYLLALRRAHKAHHKHVGPGQSECFGMLLVPLKYLREARLARRRGQAAT